MTAPSSFADAVLRYLRALVAHPSVNGDDAALESTSEYLADALRKLGFKVMLHPTEGAPIVLARRDGTNPQHMLFHNHYDVAPTGNWRDWLHEPFVLAERDDALFGRGVASDKGNLAARLAAVDHLITTTGTLPVGVTFVIEGDALQGSPHLPNFIADQALNIQTDLVLSYGGSLDSRRIPYIYTGVRGRLLMQLRITGTHVALGSDMANSVSNPAWRLLWVLNRIKNDSEEILIDDFYDAVLPPSREANKLARSLDLDEAARLEAWGINEFLLGMTGGTLGRAETFNPTCNLASFTASNGAGLQPSIPTVAEALLDFSLVPEQRPNELARSLHQYLDSLDINDVEIQSLKGAYPPATISFTSPALHVLANQIEAIYGDEAQVVPIAPFSTPLHLFIAGMNVPAIPLGIIRPESHVRSANETITLEQLTAMAHLMVAMLTSFVTFDRNRE